jgi:hypothetical protein
MNGLNPTKVRLDPYTFGKTPAFIRVSEILTEINNVSTTKSVSKLFESFRKRLKACSLIEDSDSSSYFAQLLLDDYKNRVYYSYNSRVLRDHIYNCLTTLVKYCGETKHD